MSWILQVDCGYEVMVAMYAFKNVEFMNVERDYSTYTVDDSVKFLLSSADIINPYGNILIYLLKEYIYLRNN